MPCDTQSPSPVPLPDFVEKNGSKICAMSSSGIPSPVSRTWIWTASRPKTSVSVPAPRRSEEHTSELQSHHDLVCRLLLEKKKKVGIPTEDLGVGCGA